MSSHGVAAGGFNGDYSGTVGITLEDNSTDGIAITEMGASDVTINALNGTASLQASSTASLLGTSIVVNAGGAGTVALGTTGDDMGFYGATAVAQAAAIDKVATTAPTTGAYGYTSAQAAYIIAAINDILNVIGAGAGGIGITA